MDGRFDSWIIGAAGIFTGSPEDGWERAGSFDYHTNCISRSGENLVVGVPCGLWQVSPDATWKQLHDESLTEVQAIAPVNGYPDFVAGCPYGFAEGSPDQLGAVRWTFHTEGLQPNERFISGLLALDASAGSYLVATEGGVLLAEARGKRWHRSSLAQVPARCITRAFGRYWAGTENKGIWSSEDGLSWSPAGRGLEGVTVYDIAGAGDMLLVGIDRGVAVGDGGSSWRRCGPSTLVASVGADASDPSKWLLGCWPGGLWATDDGGRSFRQSGSFIRIGAIVPPGSPETTNKPTAASHAHGAQGGIS